MDFGYLQSFLFSENEGKNGSAKGKDTEAVDGVKVIDPSTRDVESLQTVDLTQENEESSTTSSLGGPHSLTPNEIVNDLHKTKGGPFARTLGNISDRVSSLVKAKEENVEVLKDENKSVASLTESELSQSTSERELSDQERGRSSSRGRSNSRGRSASPSEPKPVEEKVQHILCFGHGRVWTCLGLFFSWLGFFLAYLSRASTDFVTVDPPIYFDHNYEMVSEVGMINLRLCLNETYVGRSGCTYHELSADDVDDMMFQLSRSVAFLAVLFGGVMASFLTVAVFWHSINLRPVGGGFLIAYFLQSFCFMFFDSTLCNDHDCTPSSGAFCAIVASLCWIGACVSTSRMDVFKIRQRKLRLRNLRRRRRQSQSRSRSPRKKSTNTKPPILGREVSTMTAQTDATNGTNDGDDSPRVHVTGQVTSNDGGGNKNVVKIDGIDDVEAAQAWIAFQNKSNLERNLFQPPDAPSSPANRNERRQIAPPANVCSRARPSIESPKSASTRPATSLQVDTSASALPTRQRSNINSPTSPSEKSSSRRALSPNSVRSSDDNAMHFRSPSFFEEADHKEIPPPPEAVAAYMKAAVVSSNHSRASKGSKSSSGARPSRDKPPKTARPSAGDSHRRGRSAERRSNPSDPRGRSGSRTRSNSIQSRSRSSSIQSRTPIQASNNGRERSRSRQPTSTGRSRSNSRQARTPQSSSHTRTTQPTKWEQDAAAARMASNHSRHSSSSRQVQTQASFGKQQHKTAVPLLRGTSGIAQNVQQQRVPAPLEKQPLSRESSMRSSRHGSPTKRPAQQPQRSTAEGARPSSQTPNRTTRRLSPPKQGRPDPRRPSPTRKIVRNEAVTHRPSSSRTRPTVLSQQPNKASPQSPSKRSSNNANSRQANATTSSASRPKTQRNHIVLPRDDPPLNDDSFHSSLFAPFGL